MDNELQRPKAEFAEELGLFLEKLGFPHMAGRIWGWLLVCDPPSQTAAQLAAAVRASRGSVSMMTRMLIQVGLIERTAAPGQRSRLYRVRSGSFAELLKAKLLLTSEIRRIAERGLELLKDKPPETRRRLQEYRDFYAFFEKEFPAFIRKWQRQGGRT